MAQLDLNLADTFDWAKKCSQRKAVSYGSNEINVHIATNAIKNG